MTLNEPPNARARHISDSALQPSVNREVEVFENFVWGGLIII